MSDSDEPSYYRPAMLAAVVQQVILLPLTIAMDHDLDVFQICVGPCIAFWVMAVVMRMRRPDPTALDVKVIRSGTIPICIFAGAITKGIWMMRGF